MDDRHRADPARVFLNLISEARVCFSSRARIKKRVPSLHQLAGRIALNDLADDDFVGQSESLHFGAGLVAKSAIDLQIIFGAAAVSVSLGPFGFGDRIPDRL